MYEKKQKDIFQNIFFCVPNKVIQVWNGILEF